MLSRKAAGAAPLITGILLAFQSAAAIVQTGPSLWSVPALLGGCAATVVGLGILLDWDAFHQDPAGSNRSAAILGIAAVAFFAGAVFAVA